MRMAIHGPKKPLSKSMNTTGSAGFQPSTRNVLVRPAFLEPYSLMSNDFPFASFAIQIALGIDPSKYAIGRLSKLFKFFILSEG